MVLKLYGFYLSTCTRRVATVLHEKNVPYEFVPVNIFTGEHKTPEFLKNQPFGVVPYLDDDGFILYESRAMCHYIATKYANQGTQGLIPTDPKKNALFQQASSTELTSFNEYAEKIAAEKVFKPMRGGKTDEEVLKRLAAGLATKLDVYEIILGKQKYLGGDEITLADLYHIPYASMLPMAELNLIDERPNVKRWYDDISGRPSWQAVKAGVTSKTA